MNDVVASIRRAFPPVHPAGYPFIAAFALATAVVFVWLSTSLGWMMLILTLWCVAFFRDPERVTPVRPGLVVSPADGVVSFVGPALPPPELGLSTAPMTRISVFMSVFDCHVNRAPVSGRVARVAYKPGLFLNADLDKASEDNERNGLIIESGGVAIGVVQIAGLVARRILCFTGEGRDLSAGERFGLIRFGSRVDTYVPVGTTVLVEVGQRAVAGETVLADGQVRADGRTAVRG